VDNNGALNETAAFICSVEFFVPLEILVGKIIFLASLLSEFSASLMNENTGAVTASHSTV
jgi:hypothetical protein